MRLVGRTCAGGALGHAHGGGLRQNRSSHSLARLTRSGCLSPDRRLIAEFVMRHLPYRRSGQAALNARNYFWINGLRYVVRKL
jgi:hypothetical protein